MRYLIIGLGNIGPEYENTRHNIGFDVLSRLAIREGISFRQDTMGTVAEFKIRGNNVTLLKPNTYMNLSGKAVRFWTQKLDVSPGNWLIIVDEIQFEPGVFKLQKKGSSGGHNGLKSIEEYMLTSEYPRLRIGIGRDFYPGKQVQYVLGKWTQEQMVVMDPVLDTCCDLVRSYASIGLEFTMNAFNRKKNPPEKKDHHSGN